MKNALRGKRIAILATLGFEQEELTSPKEALERAGATTEIISPSGGEIRAWNEKEWGDTFKVDRRLSQSDPNHYDGLLLPGGVMNPDKLRQDPEAVQFVRSFFEQGKPIAAICHGPWMLVEANIVCGRRVTSWPSLKTDLRNAGAYWTDEEVVVDNGLITSRKPADLPAFNKKVVEE